MINISRLQSAYRLRLAPGGGLQWLTLDEGGEVVLDEEPESTFWLRLHNLLIAPFVPEQLL